MASSEDRCETGPSHRVDRPWSNGGLHRTPARNPDVKPKPRHLERDYAEQFKDRSVVESYAARPPYPDESFDILDELLADQPRVVLDAGCGSGSLARPLAARVDRVDAIDFSPHMIEAGRALPGGDAPNLRWVVGDMEDTPLDPPYGMVTAGQSLHWMAWDVVMPRFAEVLSETGLLVLVGHDFVPAPWCEELRRMLERYTTNRDFAQFDLVEELESRGLFEKVGERSTGFVPLVSTLDTYVESFHSANGFSRDRMGPEAAAAFDAELRELVLARLPGGHLETAYAAWLVWGRPLA